MLEHSKGVPDDSKQSNSQSSHLLLDCADSFLEAGIQRPLIGITQIADRALGTNSSEHCKFLNKPEEHSAGSIGWLGEEISAGVGSVIPLAMSALATKPFVDKLACASLLATELPAAKVATLASLTESVAAGLVSGTILNPTADTQNFWESRLCNGITGATTMGSMHVFSNRLGRFTGADSVNAGVALKSLNTAIAGTGAGLVGAETQARLSSNRDATFKELTDSALSMGVTGGMFATVGNGILNFNNYRSQFSEVQNYVARNVPEKGAVSETYLAHQEGNSPLSWLNQQYKARVLPQLKFAQNQNNLRSGEKFPERSYSDYTPLQRVDLIGKLEENATSPLVRPEIISEFVSGLRAAARSWPEDNLAELIAKNNEAREAFYSLKGPFAKLDASAPAENAADPASVAKEIYNQRSTAVTDVIDRRAAQIQTAINKFLDSQKLPNISVQRSELSVGSASYGIGTISLHEAHLIRPELDDDTIGVLFHETIHLEQEHQITRLLAEELNVGPNITEEQLESVCRKLQPQWWNGLVTEMGTDSPEVQKIRNFYKRNLELGSSQKLSAPETARAEKLFESLNNYQSPWEAELESLSEESFQLQIARKHSTAKMNLNQIQSGGLGFDSGMVVPRTLKPLIEKLKNDDAVELSESEESLINKVLDARSAYLEKKIARLQARSYQHYMNNAKEQEAFPSGILANLVAQAS